MVYAILQYFVEFPYEPEHRLITDLAIATAFVTSGALWASCRS